MRYGVFVFVLVMVCMCGYVQMGFAQDQASAPATQPAMEPEEEAFPAVLAFEGVVEEIAADGKIKIKDKNNKIMEFTVDKDAFIFINEDTVELNKIQKNDAVYVTYQEKDGVNLADWVEVTRTTEAEKK